MLLTSVAAADTVTLYPDADTEVRSGAYANDNYGTSFAPYVREQAAATCNRMVLRFDLSTVVGTISDAKLRLYVHSMGSTDTTHRLYLMSDDSWVESIITWNNCPGTTSTDTTWPVATTDAGTWKEIDVTSLAQTEAAGDDELSLQIRADVVQNVLVQYRSKEYSGATYDPQLVVTFLSNAPPVADAGEDQTVPDDDMDGQEVVTLDGSGSSDSDGTVTGYVWKEGETEIATGQTAEVTMNVGFHTITLLVTDNGGATDDDTVLVIVMGDNFPPTAEAGDDQTDVDVDEDGTEVVTLDGSASSDFDGTITSYVWSEGGTQIATGETADVIFAVGQHTVTLVVTDNDGATGSDTVAIEVMENLAGDYFVDQGHPAASDSNPGTMELPWKTISKAAATAQAGDTVIIRAGTYREGVVVQNSGTAEQRITFRAPAGERVLVSGADPITGWQPCTEAQARGNPDWRNIYWTEAEWTSLALFVDEQPQQVARLPDEVKAMLIIEGGDESHIVDSVNLTQPAGAWEGATVTFYTTRGGGSRQSRTITAYDPDLHELTVSSPFTLLPEAGVDLYYIEHGVPAINQPGDYAIDKSVTPNRIYLWPSTGGHPGDHQVDGVRRVYNCPLVTWVQDAGYITFDGLEAGYGVNSGFGSRDDGGHHIEIVNCIAHHTCYEGFAAGFGFIDQVSDVLVRHCISYANANHGVSVGYQNGMYGGRTHDVRIEECQIFGNNVDGIQIGWFSEDIAFVRNAVWDQWAWTHPDGFQTYHGIDRITVDSNLFFNTGQFAQIECTWNADVVNNLWVGAHLNGLAPSPRTYDVHDFSTGEYLFTLPACDNFDIRHNTFAFMGAGSISMCSNSNFDYNVVVPGRAGASVITGWAPWTSDYNLYWDNTGNSKAFGWPGEVGTRFPDWQAAHGQDANTAYAPPGFRNAPELIRVGSGDMCPWYHPELNQNTTSTLWLDRVVDGEFVVGDVVEVNWDGVARTVTDLGTGDDPTDHASFIVVDPPLAARPQSSDFVVANWRSNTNLVLDLRLATDSPGYQLCPDGSDAGSTIDMQAYLAGDFDGDGVRDLPALPAVHFGTELSITRWEVVVQGHGQTWTTEVPDGHVEPRAAGISRIDITFSAPLDPSTVTIAAATIEGAAAGDVSAMISTITLSGDLRTIQVELTAALPDADRYTVTVSDAVRDATGNAITGQRSRVLSALVGDVDGSGEVTAADLLTVRSLAGEPIDATTIWCDVDCSGAVTGADMLPVRGAMGHALP